MTAPPLTVKRVHDPLEPGEGARLLVDRLWPRGIARDDARVGEWLPQVAPSQHLRRLFHADPDQWAAFVAAYHGELAGPPAHDVAVAILARLERGERLTLTHASRDRQHNNAVALEAWLSCRLVRV